MDSACIMMRGHKYDCQIAALHALVIFSQLRLSKMPYLAEMFVLYFCQPHLDMEKKTDLILKLILHDILITSDHLQVTSGLNYSQPVLYLTLWNYSQPV